MLTAPMGAVIKIANTASVTIRIPYSTNFPFGSTERALSNGMEPMAAYFMNKCAIENKLFITQYLLDN